MAPIKINNDRLPQETSHVSIVHKSMNCSKQINIQTKKQKETMLILSVGTVSMCMDSQVDSIFLRNSGLLYYLVLSIFFSDVYILPGMLNAAKGVNHHFFLLQTLLVRSARNIL